MNIIDEIDAENKELYILGDVNCNLLPEASAHNSSHLTFLTFMVLVSKSLNQHASLPSLRHSLIYVSPTPQRKLQIQVSFTLGSVIILIYDAQSPS